MSRLTADVAVLGGGPAGAVFAIRMAQLGHDVCLIERARFPRPRLGESLTPGVLPMLASVGAAAAVEAAAFPRVSRVATNWDGGEAERLDPRAEGMLVDRGRFDAILLDRARAVGVRVLQPAHARAIAQDDAGWKLRIEEDAGVTDLHAGFLADATGRTCALPARRRMTGPRTIALYGYWTGAGLPDHPRIEAGENAWYWGVPIPDGSYNTLVFVDPAELRGGPAAGLDARLQALLAVSGLAAGLREARLRAPARAADATPYVDEACVSESHIKIGDAGLALDPLSSSGVQKAIQTALSGAIVTNTLRRRPEGAAAALQYHRDHLHAAAERHHAWAAGHYATLAARHPAPFWTDRAGDAAPGHADTPPRATPSDDTPLRLTAAARLEERPCLGDQFVEVRRALEHPGLEGPVAFVGGQGIAELLDAARPGMTHAELAGAWSGTVAPEAGLRIARWLSGHGILEPMA